ncbi:MAG: aminotransferase class IV, partial [Trueperaceae bacterium]|nr:aminotransferase class IV [Trueperaceae bacterium]
MDACAGGAADDDGVSAAIADGAGNGDPRPRGCPRSDPFRPLALFETMRWEAGELLRWPRHRARLAASAAALGLPFDPAAAEAALADGIAAARAEGTNAKTPRALRVRLELRENGSLRVDAVPFDAARRTPTTAVPSPPDAAQQVAGARIDEPLPVVVWSESAIFADDPARRHKTLDRALYDEASAWARDAGIADVLFLNEHGRVAEGAISNVFVLGEDGRWRTPPVADGALPGVLRAELIDDGRAVAAQLTPADLKAGTVAIGSALRGLRRV